MKLSRPLAVEEMTRWLSRRHAAGLRLYNGEVDIILAFIAPEGARSC